MTQPSNRASTRRTGKTMNLDRKKKIAYHFVGNTLRDGTPVPKDGIWLKHTGPVKMCESGLHFSYDPLDALQYAPGPILCMVDVDGIVQVDTDKGVCSKRKIIKRFDCTDILRYFARMQALSVIHLWAHTPPDVVLDFLITGDESLRDAAWAAAGDAAGAAAGGAAWDAAGAAAWGAAWAAAWDAAWAAAGDAAWDAAGDAARDAAGDAAGDAARDAAWDAARAAARIEFRSLVNAEFASME